jgi:hypothetical protein
MMIGQKVVCVNDEFSPAIRKLYTHLPVKDVTYVVRNVELGANAKGEPGEVCLHLVGLVNPPGTVAPHRERGFNAERFRPLDDIRIKVEEEEEAYV